MLAFIVLTSWAMVTGTAKAQTLTTLHHFAGGASDGANPWGGLARDLVGNLYGTTFTGGAANLGTIFKIAPSGAATVLHSFSGSADGASPWNVQLALDSAGYLYGTTHQGGSGGGGTVFKISVSGSGFTVLRHLSGADGVYPQGGLVLDAAGNLYGTAFLGGPSGNGTVFTLKTSGSGFTVLHDFAATDGTQPGAGLVLDSAGNLYGTTIWSGPFGAGTVFRLAASGAGFSVLHGFGQPNDGSNAQDLVLDTAGNLYGVTRNGGRANSGTIFRITASGDYLLLYDFYQSLAGSSPYSGLVLDSAGVNLYGTTSGGGSAGAGTVFRFGAAADQQPAVLYAFSGGSADGGHSRATLTLDSAGNVYGTTYDGGSSSAGTLFTLSTAPVITPPPPPPPPASGVLTTLYNFAWGADGAHSWAGLVADANGNVYGTTFEGGPDNRGIVFRVDPSGKYTVLHAFSATDGDGAEPWEADLVLSPAGVLYGVTFGGGSFDQGVVFSMSVSGSDFKVLHNFAGGSSDGAYPKGGMVLDLAGNLYGATSRGGVYDIGTVFTLSTSGQDFTVLHSFSDADGMQPSGGLIMDAAGTLYGTTTYDGPNGGGTLFRLSKAGTDFRVLHGFVGPDGANPDGPLVLDSAGVLYGATRFGAGGAGVVFRMGISGEDYRVLHYFASSTDGQSPHGGMILDAAANLYGTTAAGGPLGSGTIFRISTLSIDSLHNLSVLHSFAGGNTEGSHPQAGLIRDNAGNFCGTSYDGGVSGSGTVFKFVADATPPDIAANVSGVLQNGWYTSNVAIAWAVTDNESTIISKTGCDSDSVTTDTAGATFTCSATSAGGSATRSVTIRRDATAPLILISAPAATSYTVNQTVAASYSCTDVVSGIKSCIGPVAIGANLNTTSAGVKSVTVNAADNAGNTSSANVNYTVVYNFSGYFAPVNNPPVVNTGKANRTYPVKWQLRDAGANFISALSAVKSVSYKATSCTAFNSGVTDPLEATASGSSGLRYDSVANQYLYNWASPGPGCYTLLLTLDSGQVFPAYFNLSN